MGHGPTGEGEFLGWEEKTQQDCISRWQGESLSSGIGRDSVATESGLSPKSNRKPVATSATGSHAAGVEV